MDKIAIFRSYIELGAIARQSIDALREVICAYFGNIGRNSGYFLLPIFLGSYLIEQAFNPIFLVPSPSTSTQADNGDIGDKCCENGLGKDGLMIFS